MACRYAAEESDRLIEPAFFFAFYSDSDLIGGKIVPWAYINIGETEDWHGDIQGRWCSNCYTHEGK